jgi:hypothetical protein
MKKLIEISGLFILMITISGCEVIGSIFQAGVWVGIIFILAIIAVFTYIAKLFSNNGN